MTTSQTLHEARQRLAQHYVSRLQQASLNIQRGPANKAYWFNQVEQDWAQIQHWQAWSADIGSQSKDAAGLCVEFPLVGANILIIRQNPEDRIKWLETALQLSENVSIASRCMILRLLYQACLHMNAVDKAEPYIHQLLDLARSNNEPVYEGCGIYALGTMAEERGNLDQAENYYCRSLEIFSTVQAGIDEARSLHGLSCIAQYRGQYQASCDYLLRYLSLAEQLGQENDICVALSGLAEVMICLKDLDAAERYIQRGTELCRVIGHRRVLSVCLCTLGWCEFERGNFDAALRYYEESLQIAENGAFRRSAIRTLHRTGYAYFTLGMYNMALETLEKALDLARPAKQLRFLCNILRDRANTHLALGNIAAAQEDLREALFAAQHLNSAPQKAMTILSGVFFFHQLGDHVQAAQWLGALLQNEHIAEKMFKSMCLQLKNKLGAEQFKLALKQGASLSVDNIIGTLLTCPSLSSDRQFDAALE